MLSLSGFFLASSSRGCTDSDEKSVPILHQFLTPESFQLLKTALLWLQPINLSFLHWAQGRTYSFMYLSTDISPSGCNVIVGFIWQESWLGVVLCSLLLGIPVSLAPASSCLPEALPRAQQGNWVILLFFCAMESYLKTILDLEHRSALELLKGQTAVERLLLEAL